MAKAFIIGTIEAEFPFSMLNSGDFFYLQYANVLMMKVEGQSLEPVPASPSEPFSDQYSGVDISDGKCIRIFESTLCRIPHAVKVLVQ
jgi:hypothetical protein